VGASRTTELKGTTATKPVPDGYPTVTLYLTVDDAVETMNGSPSKGARLEPRERRPAPHD
jgi:hypothetical protein